MTKQPCELIALETEFKALLERGLTQASALRVLGEATPDLHLYGGAIETARAEYTTDDLEIDDSPMLSPSPVSEGGDGGVWVSAWVWVAIHDDQDEA